MRQRAISLANSPRRRNSPSGSRDNELAIIAEISWDYRLRSQKEQLLGETECLANCSVCIGLL